MPGSRLYNFTLKQPQFEVTPFQAVAFEPKERENIGILTRSLDKIEERRNQYNEKKAGLVKMFGDLQDKLILTGEGEGVQKQRDWFNNLQQQYLNSIESWVDSGNLSGALEAATAAGAEIWNNSELQDRIKASADYTDYVKDAKQRVKDKKVSDGKLSWWLATKGQYSYDPKQDGIYKGQPFITPLYDDLSPTVLVNLASQVIHPDSSSTTTGSSTDTGYEGPEGGHSEGSSTTKSYSKSQVTAKELEDVERRIKRFYPDFDRMIEQQMQYELWRYNNQQELIDSTVWTSDRDKQDALGVLADYGQNLIGPNGVPLSRADYIKQNVYDPILLAAAAYKNTSSDVRTSTSSRKSVKEPNTNSQLITNADGSYTLVNSTAGGINVGYFSSEGKLVETESKPVTAITNAHGQ